MHETSEPEFDRFSLRRGERLAWTSRRTTPVFGRAECIERICAQLPVQRLVTIVGAGGMGKTTLALAVADALGTAYADGIHFVDLASLADGHLLPQAVAVALGLVAITDAVDLPSYLRGREALIILDSCEHLLAAVAGLVEAILAAAPQVQVLATSREPLRAQGEWLHRLEPMQLPAQTDGLSAAAAMGYPGIELFVERARASLREFILTDELAPAVARLCLRLDGIPLALELAAARVALLGVRGLAAQIEVRLLQLGAGPRRGPRRHRTLEAMLDWSHALLAPVEQLVFARLAVFCGNFTLAAACAVVGPVGEAPDEALDVTGPILDLVAKSLVASAAGHAEPTFRLLDTTRAYAAGKLAGFADQAAVRRRHALYMRTILAEAELSWERMTRSQWRSVYAPWVNDLRAALDWAFATDAELELALQITSLSFPLAEQTGMMAEFGAMIDRAVSALPRLQGEQPILEARLRTLPALLPQQLPSTRPVRASSMQDVLELARAHGEAKHQGGPLLALWGAAFQDGDYARAEHWIARMHRVALDGTDPVLGLIAKRIAAQNHHFMGRHELACELAAEVLASAPARIPLVYLPSPVDSRVSMRIVLARARWMQGRAEEAAQFVDECLALARADTPLALCQTLALAAVPIAMWSGDVARARLCNQQLHECVRTYSFKFWQPWWQAVDELLARRDGTARGDCDLAASGARASKLQDHLASFDERWLSPDTVRRVEDGMVGWCAPEVLRAQGELLLRAGPDAARRAEAFFRSARQQAREQGALAWKARADASLARLVSSDQTSAIESERR